MYVCAFIKMPFRRVPLSISFNADNHNINDLKVCILTGTFMDTNHGALTDLQVSINYET